MRSRATLFAAYSEAYRKEGKRRVVVELVDAGFVVAAIAIAVNGAEVPELSALALLWLAVREVPWFLRPGEHRRVAVKIQEQFEGLFGIPPNEVLTGEPVPDHEVLALADGSSTELPDDYFVDVDGLSPEVSALVRQHQTAAWAEVGHRRYSALNYVIAFLAVVGLLAWAYLSERTVPSAVTELVAPSAPFIVGRLQLGRRHREQSRDRADIRRQAERALDPVSSDPATHPSPSLVRSFQDRLYLGRLDEGRIPQHLYAFWANKDRRTIDLSCEQRVARLKAAVQ